MNSLEHTFYRYFYILFCPNSGDFESATNLKLIDKMMFGLAVFFLSVVNVDAFRSPTFSSASARSSSNELMMSAERKRRVVVTGLGVINGCGVNHNDFFQNCIDGKSSLRKVTRFDASNYSCSIASEVPAEMFDPADYFINSKNIKSNDRYTHFAVAAARQALKDAGVGDTPETLPNPSRVGVMIGSAFGGVETFESETLKLAAKPDRPKVSSLLLHVI